MFFLRPSEADASTQCCAATHNTAPSAFRQLGRLFDDVVGGSQLHDLKVLDYPHGCMVVRIEALSIAMQREFLVEVLD